MPESLHKAPIAIVDEDRSPLSSRIVNAFYPPHFQVPAIIDQYAMDPSMDVGLYTFVLDIPPDFQRDVLPGVSRPSSLTSTPPACRRPSSATAMCKTSSMAR